MAEHQDISCKGKKIVCVLPVSNLFVIYCEDSGSGKVLNGMEQVSLACFDLDFWWTEFYTCPLVE